jgi:hypothetical protein
MEPDATATSMTTSGPSSEESAKASDAIRSLAEIFANLKGHGSYRRYVVERIDGELVFHQTEVDAALEAAIAELRGSGRKASSSRRIIKLP